MRNKKIMNSQQLQALFELQRMRNHLPLYQNLIRFDQQVEGNSVCVIKPRRSMYEQLPPVYMKYKSTGNHQQPQSTRSINSKRYRYNKLSDQFIIQQKMKSLAYRTIRLSHKVKDSVQNQQNEPTLVVCKSILMDSYNTIDLCHNIENSKKNNIQSIQPQKINKKTIEPFNETLVGCKKQIAITQTLPKLIQISLASPQRKKVKQLPLKTIKKQSFDTSKMFQPWKVSEEYPQINQ